MSIHPSPGGCLFRQDEPVNGLFAGSRAASISAVQNQALGTADARWLLGKPSGPVGSPLLAFHGCGGLPPD